LLIQINSSQKSKAKFWIKFYAEKIPSNKKLGGEGNERIQEMSQVQNI